MHILQKIMLVTVSLGYTIITIPSSKKPLRISVATTSDDPYIMALRSPTNGRHPQMLYALLALGIARITPRKINAKNRRGKTILHMCIENPQNGPNIVDLLTQKADVNIPDSDGNTALHLAISKEKELNMDLVKLIAPLTNNLLLKNNEGKTVMDLAKERNSVMLRTYLINIQSEQRKQKDEDEKKSTSSKQDKQHES